MIFIGVDVGVHGGIAAINADRTILVAQQMPPTDHDLLDLLAHLCDLGDPVSAVLEHVASSPLMGVKSAFTFGRGYGMCRTALAAHKIPYCEVTPLTWQRKMQCLTGGDKNVTRQRAQQLFPTTKVTHAIADSLLLAEYARILNRGGQWPT